MVPLPFKVDWTPSFPAARRKVGRLAPMSIRDVLAHRKITRYALAMLIVPAYFLGVAILLDSFWTPSQVQKSNAVVQTSTNGSSLALDKQESVGMGLRQSTVAIETHP